MSEEAKTCGNSAEPSGSDFSAGRQHASAVMRDRARRLEGEARAWAALARLVEDHSDELSGDVENEIWGLACRRL